MFVVSWSPCIGHGIIGRFVFFAFCLIYTCYDAMQSEFRRRHFESGIYERLYILCCSRLAVSQILSPIKTSLNRKCHPRWITNLELLWRIDSSGDWHQIEKTLWKSLLNICLPSAMISLWAITLTYSLTMQACAWVEMPSGCLTTAV